MLSADLKHSFAEWNTVNGKRNGSCDSSVVLVFGVDLLETGGDERPTLWLICLAGMFPKPPEQHDCSCCGSGLLAFSSCVERRSQCFPEKTAASKKAQ